MKVTSLDIQDGIFIIPEGVTHIANWAFAALNNLKIVIIPHSVISIGDWAFYACSRLNRLNLPDSITYIGHYAFTSSGLTEINIPPSVTDLNDYTFACHNLTVINIPESVTYISESAFNLCVSLRIIVINSPVTSEFQRIRSLLTPRQQELAIYTYKFHHVVIEMRNLTLESAKHIGIYVPSDHEKLSEQLINHIEQYDDRVQKIINKVPLPMQASGLDDYKQALQTTLIRKSQDGHFFLRNLKTIAKLQKMIELTEAAIFMAGQKKGFFNVDKNVLKLESSLTIITVIRKLMAWLSGNRDVSFTKHDKQVINQSKALKLILENQGVDLNTLPNPYLINSIIFDAQHLSYLCAITFLFVMISLCTNELSEHYPITNKR